MIDPTSGDGRIAVMADHLLTFAGLADVVLDPRQARDLAAFCVMHATGKEDSDDPIERAAGAFWRAASSYLEAVAEYDETTQEGVSNG